MLIRPNRTCIFHLLVKTFVLTLLIQPLSSTKKTFLPSANNFIHSRYSRYMFINNFVVFLATIPVTLYYSYYWAQMSYIYIGMAVLFWNTADWYVKALMTSKKFNKEKAED